MNKFCLYAWEGIYISPTGDYSSCCDMEPVGKFDTIDQFTNSKQMQNIRQSLLNNEMPSACERCWRKERAGLPSSRTNINSSKLNTTTYNDSDCGSIVLWDIRDNNLCNMSCRMCGAYCSSMWNQEILNNPDIERQPTSPTTVLRVNDSKHTDIIDTFKRNIDDVKLLYWAGGEPLINDTHWQVLQMLQDAGRHDVQLRYNTNMLKLDYKGRNAVDEWKKFTGHVGVTVSLDCIGKRAEYARNGTKWDTLERNIDYLLEHFKDNTHVSITTSIYTIADLTSTLDWIHSKGIDKIFFNNVLYTPEYLCIDLLPADVKQQYVEQLEPYNNQDMGYNQVVHMLTRPVNADKINYNRKQFVKFTNTLDKSRQQSVAQSCPELAQYMKEWI